MAVAQTHGGRADAVAAGRLAFDTSAPAVQVERTHNVLVTLWLSHTTVEAVLTLSLQGICL